MIYSNEKSLSVMTKHNSQTKIKKMPYQGSRMGNFNRAFMGLTGVVYWPYRVLESLHGAFEGEHVKTMLVLYSLPSWGQHNERENYMGPSGAQLKISTRVLVIWEGIGFMREITFGNSIKSLRFETP